MDKAALELQIAKTMDRIIDLISKHTDDELAKSPRPDAWTNGQLAWHVVKASEDMEGANTRKSQRPYDQHVEEIKATFLNQSNKMKSPPFLIPEKTFYSVSEVLTALKKNKQAQLKNIKDNDLTDEIADIELPVWGRLTRFEWLKLLQFHVQRHTDQLEGYLSNP